MRGNIPPRHFPGGGVTSSAAAGQTGGMRIRVLVVALVALLVAVVAAPAQASEERLRTQVHARMAVFMGDAVDSGLYSAQQNDYVLSILLNSDPRSLSERQEQKVLGAFWRIITEEGGVSQAAAEVRLRAGWTLTRIVGDDADAVKDKIYRWLSNPVGRAILNGTITFEESRELRANIRTSINRLMAQPGGGDRPVILVPQRS